jgi:hypothetical protein
MVARREHDVIMVHLNGNDGLGGNLSTLEDLSTGECVEKCTKPIDTDRHPHSTKLLPIRLHKGLWDRTLGLIIENSL